MGERSRYSTKGEEDGVLTNKSHIQDQEELDAVEALLFKNAYQYFVVDGHASDRSFDAKLLFDLHEYFLSPLYSWAGKIRTVNMSKGGVLFAPVEHIHSALNEFERILTDRIPTSESSKHDVAMNLAIIHCEFNAIHPFREGNGRTIRLFLDLIAVHIGYNPIDWSKRSQKTYINACIDGMAGEYSAMNRCIFAGLAKRT